MNYYNDNDSKSYSWLTWVSSIICIRSLHTSCWRRTSTLCDLWHFFQVWGEEFAFLSSQRWGGIFFSKFGHFVHVQSQLFFYYFDTRRARGKKAKQSLTLTRLKLINFNESSKSNKSHFNERCLSNKKKQKKRCF